MTSISDRFSDICAATRTRDDLTVALAGHPDIGDCLRYGLTEGQWRAGIATAIRTLAVPDPCDDKAFRALFDGK